MSDARSLPTAELDRLFSALARRGYTCVGPTVRDEAIVYDQIDKAADLPQGWTDVQGPGEYRLERRADEAYFGFVVGPHSWKKYLFPPEQRLWRLRRGDRGFEVLDEPADPPRYAFIGVRACEIAALEIQDRVFQGGRYADGPYVAAREKAIVVGVTCTQSAATCFCTSTKTGPQVSNGYDLSLTELVDSGCFLVRAEGARGLEVLEELDLPGATAAELEAEREGVARAARQQRRLDQEGLPELLERNQESGQWDEIASRCLACANCTMVCPTCFCSDVEDVSDLSGEHAERWRRWDSCFNAGFSYIHGGEVRSSIRAKYRQWLTHKLGHWVEQFGTSGCVGCGRCISWCPVGIDLTEEVARMRAGEEA